jgi:hypothetical protein
MNVQIVRVNGKPVIEHRQYQSGEIEQDTPDLGALADSIGFSNLDFGDN